MVWMLASFLLVESTDFFSETSAKIRFPLVKYFVKIFSKRYLLFRIGVI